jgi:hypothetical protein
MIGDCHCNCQTGLAIDATTAWTVRKKASRALYRHHIGALAA